MNDKADATLARKRRRSAKDLTGSTEPAEAVSSGSPKGILDLGRAIVDELRLDTRGETLQRWLAHHLAELIDDADSSTGTKKAKAEQKAVDLILKLWAHRRSLPESADPLGGLRKAIDALAYLMPPANPWARHLPSENEEGLLAEMFRSMSQVVVSGIVLTQISRLRPVSAVESAFLEEEERMLEEAFEAWLPIANPPQPNPAIVRIIMKGQEESPEEKPSEESVDWDSLSPEQQEEHATKIAKLRIADQLEQMQVQIGTLLDRWRSNGATMNADE